MKDLNHRPDKTNGCYFRIFLITGIEKTASDILYSVTINANYRYAIPAQYYAQTPNESQSQYQLDEGANNVYFGRCIRDRFQISAAEKN